MNSLSRRLTCLSAFLILSACGDDDLSDLKQFVKEIKAIEGEEIEPLEAIKKGDFFYYELDDSRDPFIQVEQIEEVMEVVDLPKKITNGIKPDFSRIKEDLESFPLDSLKMVGTVKTDQLWALIRSEEGIQKVKLGNYLGKNHGKIIQLSTMEIKLEEIVKEDEESGIWIKKEAKLPLDMGVNEQK